MNINKVVDALEQYAPLPLQEGYDNAGLQVGLTETVEVSGALLCLDVTEQVVDEAIEKGCNLIVSHHPLIFRKLARIADEDYVQRTVRKAIKHDIAIVSMHTNMDAATGGVNFKIAEKLGLKHLQFFAGEKEVDGKGTIFTTSQCLLAPHRNQPFTQQDIEKQLLNFFHAKRIVWLDHGNLVGDDTDGHIDTIVRVAPHDTLLYVGCDDAEDEQYADFQALEKQLKGLLTYEGYPYRLLRLPMPDAIYDDDERLPATYANFLIINGAVIYPTYGQPEKDEEARRQIQLAFPDREIIGVDSRTIIRQHGSIHCLTMQLPEGTIREQKEI
jgi:dinuclear metal center YbgI/SA1388 family protein